MQFLVREGDTVAVQSVVNALVGYPVTILPPGAWGNVTISGLSQSTVTIIVPPGLLPAREASTKPPNTKAFIAGLTGSGELAGAHWHCCRAWKAGHAGESASGVNSAKACAGTRHGFGHWPGWQLRQLLCSGMNVLHPNLSHPNRHADIPLPQPPALLQWERACCCWASFWRAGG